MFRSSRDATRKGRRKEGGGTDEGRRGDGRAAVCLGRQRDRASRARVARVGSGAASSGLLSRLSARRSRRDLCFLSQPPDEFRTGAAAVCRCCRRTCRQRWRRRRRQQQRSRTAAIASEPRQPRLHRRIRRTAEPASVERRGRRRIDPLRIRVCCAATKSHIAQSLDHIQTHSQTGAARSDPDATDPDTTDGCEGKRGRGAGRGEERNG